MKYSSQHPKVKAWAEIREWLFAKRDETTPATSEDSTEYDSRITLRKMFAGVWAVAALAFTAREDIETVFAVGVPAFVLLLCIIVLSRKRRSRRRR